MPELLSTDQDEVDVTYKTTILHEHGIAVIRAHNCWDRYPEYGIEASLCAVLEMHEPVEYLGGFHSLYEIPQTTLRELAAHCKTKLGLPCVRVSGDLAKTVEKVVLAYGAPPLTWAWA